MNNNKAHTHAHEEGDGDMWGKEREGAKTGRQTGKQTKTMTKIQQIAPKTLYYVKTRWGKIEKRNPV